MNVDELLSLERELTVEELEFIEQELLKTAEEFQKVAAELSVQIEKEDPELAEQLRRSAKSMMLNLNEAVSIPFDRPDGEAN